MPFPVEELNAGDVLDVLDVLGVAVDQNRRYEAAVSEIERVATREI